MLVSAVCMHAGSMPHRRRRACSECRRKGSVGGKASYKRWDLRPGGFVLDQPAAATPRLEVRENNGSPQQAPHRTLGRPGLAVGVAAPYTYAVGRLALGPSAHLAGTTPILGPSPSLCPVLLAPRLRRVDSSVRPKKPLDRSDLPLLLLPQDRGIDALSTPT
jgi:hypothetical protein